MPEHGPTAFESLLGRVCGGDDLSFEEMASAVDAIMDGRCNDAQVAMLLTALRAKGESVEEVAGAAAALRKHMTPIPTQRKGVLDTCGTGGDGSRTFNISTAAALVTAAAGVPVAKHGNRAVTSRTGSADVLTDLGVNIQADVACVSRCLDELGICFCFAPLLHPAMKRVSEIRKKLGVPTVFNLLGPLSNPAGAEFQLLGVGKPELRRLLAEALALLGTRRALVVCGDDGLDEVTLAGRTNVSEAAAGGVKDFAWMPEDFGLPWLHREELLVSGPAESAAMIRGILQGQPGGPRDIVVANAAAGLWTAGKSASLTDCVTLVTQAIDSGAARELLARLVQLTNN